MVELRYYQKNAISALYSYFNHNKGNPVVAMPTGTGKSVVIGGFAYDVMQRWPQQRFLVATHVKELVKQNANKFNEIWPGAPMGIFSAGLKSKDYQQPVVFGGIASMVKNPSLFGWRDLLLVDECHLISDNDAAMYQAFIKSLQSINPKLKTVGFTATPYRQGMGMLTEGNLFTDICYDLTSMEAFNTLVAQGYMSMLLPYPTHIGVDDRGLKTASNGDYVQGEAEKRVMQVTWQALNDAARFKMSRQSWVVFAGGIEHAEKTTQMLNYLGIKATCVHGGNAEYKMTGKERDERIAAYKRGEYQAIVNYGILTTGFDHPPVDLIIVLRLTKSVVLWVQMLGRGTRPFAGDEIFAPKHNCIVLDYARNTARLGPINDPILPRKKGQGAGEAPVKECEECGAYNHISARYCIGCGCEFEFSVKITKQASDMELVRDLNPVYERFQVSRVFYARHSSKASGLDSLRVMYHVHGRTLPFNQYISLESSGKARERAVQWWATRSPHECPPTIGQALMEQSKLRTPTVLTVWTNLEHPEIVRCDYD